MGRVSRRAAAVVPVSAIALGIASVIEWPLKPTQTKNQLRNVKVTQLYITGSDVTQHENFFQHFAVTHVEKMLRLSNRRGRPARTRLERVVGCRPSGTIRHNGRRRSRFSFLVCPLHTSGTRAAGRSRYPGRNSLPWSRSRPIAFLAIGRRRGPTCAEPAVRLLLASLALLAANVCVAASLLDPPASAGRGRSSVRSVPGPSVRRATPAAWAREIDCRRLSFDDDGEPTWSPTIGRSCRRAKTPCGRRSSMSTAIACRPAGDDATEGLAVFQSLVVRPARWRAAAVHHLVVAVVADSRFDQGLSGEGREPGRLAVGLVHGSTPRRNAARADGLQLRRPGGERQHAPAGRRQPGESELENREHPDRPAVGVALMAAAFDADWVIPGAVHQRAITQIERMVVVTNRHDPAMRFFKLSTKISSADALGLYGVPHIEKLGTAAKRVHHIDVTAEVGRSHVIYDYLDDTPKMNRMWQQLLDEEATPLRDLAIPAYAGLDADTAMRWYGAAGGDASIRHSERSYTTRGIWVQP